MTTITDFPAIRPSLLLDFSNSGRVDPRISCVRASTATCFGSDGRLRTVAANVARLDFSPETGKCLGLLVEEARTNLAYPSNMPTSTVQTTTGVMQANGSTKITSGLEAPDGTLTGFSVEGADISTNSTGANNMRLLAVATTVGTYVLSFWLKAQSGVKVNAREASSAAITQFSPTSSWKRVSVTFTTIAVNQNIILYSELGARFDVWGVQFEAGAFPTSYIPTSTSAVTRAADLLSMDYAQDGSGGSLLADAVVRGAAVPSFVARLHKLSNHYIGIGYPTVAGMTRSGFLRAAGDSGATVATPSTGGSIGFGNAVRTAIAWGGGVFRVAFGGGISADTMPASVFPDTTQILFGADAAAGPPRAAMTISRVAVYSKQLTALQLQRLTQL